MEYPGNTNVSTGVYMILVLSMLGICYLESSKDIGADTFLMFKGKIVDTAENEEIIMLICIANRKTFECSMEFLHNNSTVESLRNSDGGCYDKNGKCQPGICSCSEDCTSYQWNFTTSSLQQNDSLGCHIRIYNSTYKSFHKVYALVVYNGTDFTSMTSVKWPRQTISGSPSKEKDTVDTLAVVLITVFGLVVLFIGVGFMADKCTSKQNGKKSKYRGVNKRYE